MKKAFIFSLAAIFMWVTLHTLVISVDGLTDTSEAADVAVVLGNKIEASGQPSERLAARLDKAIDLYKNNQVQSIVVSGGDGETGFNEADVMATYLIEQNIPQEKIILDTKGVSTISTAINTSSILQDYSYDNVIIVTQFYHVTRTHLAFRKHKINVVGSAHANYFEIRDLYSLAREFPAFYKYLFI